MRIHITESKPMFPLLTDVPVRVPVSWRWCWLEQVWGCVAGPGGAGRPAGTSRGGAGAWHCSATPPPAPPHPHQPTGTAAVGISATEHCRGNRSDLCGGKSVRANGKNAPYFKHRCFVFLRIQIDNHKNMKTNVKNNKYWLPEFLKRVIRFLKRALQLKKNIISGLRSRGAGAEFDNYCYGTATLTIYIFCIFCTGTLKLVTGGSDLVKTMAVKLSMGSSPLSPSAVLYSSCSGAE